MGGDGARNFGTWPTANSWVSTTSCRSGAKWTVSSRSQRLHQGSSGARFRSEHHVGARDGRRGSARPSGPDSDRRAGPVSAAGDRAPAEEAFPSRGAGVFGTAARAAHGGVRGVDVRKILVISASRPAHQLASSELDWVASPRSSELHQEFGTAELRNRYQYDTEFR